MRIINIVQNHISSDINKIKYVNNLRYPRYKSNLSKKLNIDYWSMIEPPALNGEKTTTSDLTRIIQLANNRTQSETKLVISVDKDPLVLFTPFLQKKELIFPESIFKNLYAFLSEMTTDLKYFYNRARPAQLADFYGLTIDVLRTKTHHTPSYPSGHTTYASLIACILSDLYPDYASNFWNMVDICANCRILQGVHFDSDNQASIHLVKKVYKQLKTFDYDFSSKYKVTSL